MLVSNSLKATSSTWSFIRIGFDLQLLYSETFDDVMLPVRRIVESKDKRRIFVRTIGLYSQQLQLFIIFDVFC